MYNLVYIVHASCMCYAYVLWVCFSCASQVYAIRICTCTLKILLCHPENSYEMDTYEGSVVKILLHGDSDCMLAVIAGNAIEEETVGDVMKEGVLAIICVGRWMLAMCL